jgi:hypothetical protein
MAKKCEQCGGVYAKAYERCPECAPQPSVPLLFHSGETEIARRGVDGYFSRGTAAPTRQLHVRTSEPSVPSGEAVRNALRRVLDNADWDDLADLANAMTGQRDVNTHEMADALLAAPPQERVSEAMVEDVRYIVLDRNGRTVGNGYSTAKDAHAYAELCATGNFAFYIAGRPHRVIRRTVTTTDATLAAHQGTEL